jgi:hypothetical protein
MVKARFSVRFRVQVRTWVMVRVRIKAKIWERFRVGARTKDMAISMAIVAVKTRVRLGIW